MRRCRAVLSAVLHTFAVLSRATRFIWALTSPFAMDEYLQLTNADGTVSRYRLRRVVTGAGNRVQPDGRLVARLRGRGDRVRRKRVQLVAVRQPRGDNVFNAQFHTATASCTTIGHRGVSFRSPSPHASEGSYPVDLLYFTIGGWNGSKTKKRVIPAFQIS